jgi:hypothetical protein
MPTPPAQPEPQYLPDIDPDEEVGAAPVSPQDGKDPYPPDVLFVQDPDAGLVGGGF